MSLRYRGSRSKVPSGVRNLFGTQYQSDSEFDRSLSDRSGALVLTGTATNPVLSLSTGTSTPLKGVRTSERVGRESSGSLSAEAVSGVPQGNEVLMLDAALLPVLPLPVTLYCAHTLVRQGIYLCFEPAVLVALKQRSAVVFGELEWEALVSAFRYGRASSASFSEWCECKAQQPTWKLNLADALGCVLGSEPDADQCVTVGAVLAGWGCQLRSVIYGKDMLSEHEP